MNEKLLCQQGTVSLGAKHIYVWPGPYPIPCLAVQLVISSAQLNPQCAAISSMIVTNGRSDRIQRAVQPHRHQSVI